MKENEIVILGYNDNEMKLIDGARKEIRTQLKSRYDSRSESGYNLKIGEALIKKEFNLF